MDTFPENTPSNGFCSSAVFFSRLYNTFLCIFHQNSSYSVIVKTTVDLKRYFLPDRDSFLVNVEGTP